MDFTAKNARTDLILTANSRLARYLQTQHDEAQQHLGKTAWETLPALPLSRFLETQFHKHNHEGLLLLSDFQEQCLWERIVSEGTHADTLLQPREMARLAQQAHALLARFLVPKETLASFSGQPEVASLIEWIAAFQQELQEKNWTITAFLPLHLSSKNLALPERIILMGFDYIEPCLKNLFLTIEKKIPVISEILSHTSSCKKQIVLRDLESELQTMAAWAKAELQKNPSARIGCVIPNLNAIHHKVSRVFTETFCIEHILPGFSANPLPFNISAGYTLSEHPMIQTAFSMLKWCKQTLPIDEIAPLLQSHYLWHNESEKNKGAQIDALLRKKNSLNLSLNAMLEYIPRWQLFETTYCEKQYAKLMPSQWAAQFITLLKCIHWPASRTQSSEEFQVLERFKKLLQEFSQLDLLFHSISFTKALTLLKTLAQETIFQPQSHHEPIQIMGTLEASSILFDATWIMGMDDHTWPPATKPHPLIPHAIQQQFDMPHATAKRELQFCKQITERLKNSGEIVIFSASAQEGDQHYSPSQLIANIPVITLSELALPFEKSFAEKIMCSEKKEAVDDNAPAIANTVTLRGGSEILQLQALCPFRAFATIRLNARPLNTPTLGIPAHTKGTWIHQILFYVWDTLQDQTGLLEISNVNLTELITQAIDRAALDLSLSQDNHLIDIEKKRLLLLIQEWLAHEKCRPYFRVVERESTAAITVGPLSLQIRQDRVDELKDGSRLLIDYKTSPQSTSGWFQERLHQSQLPLYAAFHSDTDEKKYHGICFAEITTAKMTMKGVVHENHLYANQVKSTITPIHQTKNEWGIQDWNTLIQTWKNTLEGLAHDFYKGVATVNPLKPTVCQTCQLQSVCRYNHALTGNMS